MNHRPKTSWLSIALLCLCMTHHVKAQRIISGNENKVDLITGGIRVIPPKGTDSLSIVSFSKSPPSVQTLDNIPNTVIGPPSNIAVTPDGSLALVANSAVINPTNATKWIPNNGIHVLDLTTAPPRIIAEVTAGSQPSGISISRNGKFAIVANRAEGSVTLLQIAGKVVTPVETVKVCMPEESLSDVAISPDGQSVLASAQKGGYLAVLKMEKGHLHYTGQNISTYGQPYRCVITPDGELGLTAGQGLGNGLDNDAVTVIDMKSKPLRAIQHVTIGAMPESIEISPNGKLLAAVAINGSNLPLENPNHTSHGLLEILVRHGETFEKKQSIPTGPAPQGVAFTSDGKHIIVQCHPSQELWVFSVKGEKVKDTGTRVKLPGNPASIRAIP